jgi:serine/threonine-protein kinase
VLVGVDGLTRITDFGVARAATRLTATRVGQLKGKIAYMAPEQATGAVDVDRRADVFSSGIVLWEVLAARRLFKAENEAATLSRVISEPIPELTEIAPEVHAQVAEVVMKALERDPDKRYATCQQFADALERAAVAVDKIAPQRELAAYVSEVLGNEIAQQREAVRTWLARSEVSQAMAPDARRGSGAPDMSYPTVSGVAPASGAPQVAPAKKTTVQLVAIAGGLALLVGVGIVMLAGRSSDAEVGAEHREQAAAAAEPAATSANAVTTAAVAAPPTESASAAAAQSGEQATADAAPPAPEQPKTPATTAVRPKSTEQPSTPRSRPAPRAVPKTRGDDVNLDNPYR